MTPIQLSSLKPQVSSAAKPFIKKKKKRKAFLFCLIKLGSSRRRDNDTLFAHLSLQVSNSLKDSVTKSNERRVILQVVLQRMSAPIFNQKVIFKVIFHNRCTLSLSPSSFSFFTNAPHPPPPQKRTPPGLHPLGSFTLPRHFYSFSSTSSRTELF